MKIHSRHDRVEEWVYFGAGLDVVMQDLREMLIQAFLYLIYFKL